MSEKQRRTLSLDAEVDDYLDQPHINASGFVNDLVKRHMNGGGDAIREFRIRQLEDEAEDHADRAERKREQAERLKQLNEEEEAEHEEELESVIEQLSDVPRDPTNPAIKTKAKKVGMTPEELIEELPDRDDGGELNSL